jgi:uncharacterized repeat protein (TIGR01451 family)
MRRVARRIVSLIKKSTLVAESDITISLSVDDGTPFLGGTVVFTLNADNAGPDDATDVEVSALLPAGLTYVSDDGGGAYDDGTGVWTVGDLDSGTDETLEITATVDAFDEIEFEALLTASIPEDTNLVNNADVVTVTAEAPADIHDGLLMWHRSDVGVFSDAGVTPSVNAGAVQQWNDLSGNDNHLIQETGAAQPVYDDDGGALYSNKPTVNMTAGDYLAAADITFGNHTVFTVGLHATNQIYLWNHSDAVSTAAGNYQYCYGDTSASYEDKRAGGGDPGDVGLNISTNWLNNGAIVRTITNRSDGSTRSNNLVVRINGIDVVDADLGLNDSIIGNPTFSAPFTLGAFYDGSNSGTHFWTEVIVYNRYLSTAEVEAVELYLKTRYAHYA